MKRIITLACVVLLVALPLAALGAQFPVLYPPPATMFSTAFTSSDVDGFNHVLGTIDTSNLDLFMVTLSPSGIPAGAFPWTYGRVVGVQQLSANVYRVTWSVWVSRGGFSATFQRIGDISLNLVI